MNTFAGDLALSNATRSTRDAHYQRVAALAREIARTFPLQIREIEAVAWLHECPRDIFNDLAESNPVVRGLLHAHGKDPGALMGEIVTAANAIDEMIEWLPVEYQSVTGMLEELNSMNELGLWRNQVGLALGKIVKDRWEAVLAAGDRLPVAAISSVRNLATIPVEEVSRRAALPHGGQRCGAHRRYYARSQFVGLPLAA